LMGRDWPPQYADMYMAKFEKEVHLKCPLQPHTYYRYLDDIFIVWTHGEDSFMDYLNILNDHEPPIRFKYVMHKERIDFLVPRYSKILSIIASFSRKSF